ncbi:Polynucleotidyl transferase, ribonuclease H superfamily protein [Trifolium repens]|nr:Polynucleotidyl transferase, ribonuclease H superfamily protein [Trifolium repens]
MQEILEETRRWKVKDVASTAGEWNFGLIQDLVSSSIVQKMHDVVPPNASHEEDVMLWSGTNTGQFTVSAAYHLIAGDVSNNVDKKWHQIWKLDSMERIRVFIWLLVHDRLLTKARLARWQLDNSFCDRCTQFDETTLHVVRDCPTTVNILRHLLSSPQERGIFFVVEFHEWINLNLTNKFGRRYGNDWKAIWATACFLLWQWRNKSIHDAEFVSPERPWKVIEDYVNTYKISTRAEEHIGQRHVQQWMDIRWLTPAPGWFVLNTDGVAKASNQTARCGGVLRCDKGTWIEGFTKALGDTTAYIAELWGIYEGLRLAQRRGVTRLEMQIDSQVIAQTLKDNTNGSGMGCALIKRIRSLLDGQWEVKIMHIYREANRCADMLANMGSEGVSEIEFFERPPSRVLQIVEDDVRSVSYPG